MTGSKSQHGPADPQVLRRKLLHQRKGLHLTGKRASKVVQPNVEGDESSQQTDISGDGTIESIITDVENLCRIYVEMLVSVLSTTYYLPSLESSLKTTVGIVP